MKVNFVNDIRKQKFESPIEEMLGIHLLRFANHLDIPVLTQQKIQVDGQKFRADFMIEFDNKKYVIECDGHEFHEKTKKQVEYNNRRQRLLTKSGYVVVRYSGSEIYRDAVKCAIEIIEMVIGKEFVVPSPNPLDLPLDFFVQIPNRIWDIADSLSGKEKFSEILFLYAYLLSEKSYARSSKEKSATRISINHIHEDLKFSTSKAHPDENKKRIRNLLVKLRDLEFVHFEATKIEYHKLIPYEIKNPTEDYQKIDSKLIRSCLSDEQDQVYSDRFAVLCYLKKCEGYKTKISYKELADKIGRSDTTTKELIKTMEFVGLIQVKHSETHYTGDTWRKEKNEYKVLL